WMQSKKMVAAVIPIAQADEPKAAASGRPTAPFAIVSHYVPPSRFGQPRVLYRILRQLPAEMYGLLSTTRYDRQAPAADHDGPWLDAPYLHIDLCFPWRVGSPCPGAPG